MTTEAGKQAALDQQVSQMEAFGRQVDDAQYERMRQGMAFAPYITGAIDPDLRPADGRGDLRHSVR